MSDGIKIQINGLSQVETKIESIQAALQAATRQATGQAGGKLQVLAVEAFNTPPAPFTRSGNLQRSIKQSTISQTGAGRYSMTVSPQAIYARIQEKGGNIVERRAGWNAVRLGIAKSPGQFLKRGLNIRGSYLDTVTIHPHPYFTPAVQKTRGQMSLIYGNAWRKAFHG